MQWQGYIPQSRVGELKEKVAKLNKKAAKIGVTPITVEMTGLSRRDEYRLDEFGPKHVTMMVEIIMEGETPKYEGWKLLAVLMHDPNLESNIVKTVPGEAIPEGYRTRPGVCDHCGYKRIRKETFVVQHEGGDIKQVGRQCVADFLGHGDPRRFIKTYEWFDEAMGWGREYSGLRDERENYSLVSFLAMTNAVIRKFGWVSGKKSYEEGVTSTATEVITQFGDRRTMREEDKVRPTDDDVEYAEKVIQWAQGINAVTEYEHNLKTIADCQYVIRKTQGYAASMIMAFKIATEPKNRERKVSDYYGTVGQKIVNLPLNFIREYSFETMYGVTHLQKFNDDNGNLFVWGASRWQDLEEGKKYLVSGTIKAHKDYKGIKQTVITRCKVRNV
jgi:hypothetical protein